MRKAEVIREQVENIDPRTPASIKTIKMLEILLEVLLDIREEKK